MIRFQFWKIDSVYAVAMCVAEGNGGRFSGGFDINVFEKVHATGMILLSFSLLIVLA